MTHVIALPNTITIDYNQGLYLKYSINETVHNNSNPLEFHNTTHQVELNITFSEAKEWIISATYDLYWLNPKYITKEFFHREFEYRFRDDSKYIYQTSQNMDNINFTDSHAFISGKTNLIIGQTEMFRIDALWITLGGDHNDEQALRYTGDSTVKMDNVEYASKHLEGNITDIDGCGS